MTIEVPDLPATERFSPDELRLELACALFAQREVSSATGSRMPGVDLFTFQRAGACNKGLTKPLAFAPAFGR